MTVVGPVAVLSRRGLQTRVWQAALYELEDLVAGLAETTLLVPEPLGGARRRLARGAALARRAVGRSGAAPVRPVGEPVDADLFLGVFATPWELDLLPAARRQLERSACKVAFVVELYPPGIAAVRDRLRLLRGFDHVFVFSRGVLGEVERVAGVSCTYLPTGVDALRFVPERPAPRVLDVVSYGRRLPGPHERLLAAAGRGDLVYLCDTVRGSYDVTSHTEHRAALAATLGRARYTVVHRINDDPGRLARTGGEETLTSRYFETTAAGAVVLGSAPDTRDFLRAFPWPDAVVDVRADGTDVLEVVATLDADPARVAAARRAGMLAALREHDWAYRFAEMLAAVGRVPGPAFAERRALLEARAASLAAADDDAASARA